MKDILLRFTPLWMLDACSPDTSTARPTPFQAVNAALIPPPTGQNRLPLGRAIWARSTMTVAATSTVTGWELKVGADCATADAAVVSAPRRSNPWQKFF